MHNTFLILRSSLLDFESEHQELWDWLIDMESIVMDTHDLMMSEEQQQHLYKVRAYVTVFTWIWKIWLSWQVFLSEDILTFIAYIMLPIRIPFPVPNFISTSCVPAESVDIIIAKEFPLSHSIKFNFIKNWRILPVEEQK